MAPSNLQLPANVSRVAVFDTNAYRQLVGGADPTEAKQRAARLASYEARSQTQALASPTVLFELLAHLADPTAPDYRSALLAVIAAFTHCQMCSDNGGTAIAVCASADLQLCMSLFRVRPDALIGGDDLIGAMTKRVAEDPTEDHLDAIRTDLRKVRDICRRQETEFAHDMQRHLMDQMEKSCRARGASQPRKELLTGFRDYLATELSSEVVAMAHVLRAASHAGQELADQELKKMSRWLMAKFPVPISMYKQICRKIAESNWDLTQGKGANLLWDLQVSFSIGDEHTVLGRPTIVVTRDKEIVTAAVACGVESRVLDLDTYRTSLSF
jgi:hypothetical protein